MGQTLTHGIYLPDEGERNCYNGLAANWQLLDGAVGTVAEHTTQIAGKASASHTHGNITNDGKVGTAANKPLITGTGGVVQAGAFGNQANTFCEGNDSRLSDARTPVAHTHLTADVTDLLNGAHTWTGANTFQGGGIRVKDTAAVSAGGYGAAIYFYDYQGTRYGYIQPYVTSDNYKNIIIGADGTGRIQLNSDLVPYYANAVNLGNSTLKWKTLNGINPGALSLLNRSAVDNIDTTNWDKRATNVIIATITASVDCWINVQIQRDVDFSVWVIGSYRQLFRAGVQGNGKYLVMLLFPMDKNSSVNLYTLPLDTLESDLNIQVAKYFSCQGNV